MANEENDILEKFEAEINEINLNVYSTTSAKKRWLLVDNSLGILHNLAKAKDNLVYFQGADSRRVLDIYKAAASDDRRLFSLLILSYVTDPETDVEIIKDDSDVIDQLLRLLNGVRSGHGDRRGFSLQEVLEGLENLSLHPHNKEKILTEGVPILLDISESCKTEEKNLVIRTLSKLGLFLEEGEVGDIAESVQEEGLQDDIMFVESLLGSLSEFDPSQVSEVQDIMKAVLEVTSKHNRKTRSIILDKAINQNIADILMSFFTKLFMEEDASLYDDDNNDKFQAMYMAVALLMSYSDVSVSFASVMGKAGLVTFLLSVCDKHYDNLMQMRERLKGMERILRGKVPKHLESLLEDNEKTYVDEKSEELEEAEFHAKEGLSDTDTEIEKFRFVPMGIRAGVKYGGKVAYRMDAEIDDVFNNKAVFLTNKPLKDNQMYEIKIDRFNSNLPFSLAMGVCMYSEFPEDVVYYGDGHGKGTGFWILRTGDFWQDFTHIGSSYPLNFENIKRGDRIGLARHSNGTLHYFLNGESKGIAFKNVPEGVFPVVAVTGKCLQVSIVDDPSPVVILEEEEDKTKKSIETFYVDAAFGAMQTFRRSRAPMGRDFEYQPLPKSQDDIAFLNKTLEEKRKAQEQAYNIYFHLDNIQENLAQIVKRAQKGYMVERDLLYMIQMTVECVMLIVKGGCERDPISKTPYQFVGLTLKIQGALLNAYHRNVAPEDPNTLTGRLSNIFECVVKRCFGNIRNLDGYIWTGSTSEGFALTDYSEGSEIRLDDEMDIMVPIATIAEGSRGGQMFDEIQDILVQTNSPQVEGGANIGLTLNFEESQQFHDNSCQKSKDEQISMITENSSSTDSPDEGKVQTPRKETATPNTQRSEVCDVTGEEGEKTPECSVKSAVAVSTAKGDVNEETCLTRPIDTNMSNQQSGSENNDNSLVKAFETAAQLSPTDEPLRNPKPRDKAGSDLYFGASAPENVDREAKPKGLERYISELEEVGTRQPRKHPAFIWVKASHPGYVKVQIPANRKKLFSDGLIRHLCTVENEDGEEVIYLSRTKLLKIQEAFVRSEIPSVQYCIDVLPPVWGENRGTLEVVQQGPVQTLCLHHHLK
ncbi:uncharacterized protein [Ptychodera flava]|uniref:uncharacterized protein n=1 Tax=Ptychodera flava TaxID=63121 RepID=UPI00396A4048